MTNADALVCSENPEPIVVTARSFGGLFQYVRTSSRSTVPLLTTAPFAATVPCSTLVTNRSAFRPWRRAAMSHGPLMPWPEIVSRTVPWLSSTIRQPAFAVAAIPFIDGVLPTTTHPPRSTSSAVVSPTPPGHRPVSSERVMRANRVCLPPGETCTIVVPVPCRLALLLKLLTRMSPRRSLPRFSRTTTIPYGLTSPLPGTVEAMVLSLLNWLMNGDDDEADAAADIASPALTVRAAVAAVASNR